MEINYAERMAFIQERDKLIEEYEKRGLSSLKARVKFYKSKKNIEKAIRFGLFTSSEHEEVLAMVKSFLKKERTVKKLVESGVEIKDIHSLLPEKLQTSKYVLMQAMKGVVENDTPFNYDTGVKVKDKETATYGLRDLIQSVKEDSKFSKDEDFVMLFNDAVQNEKTRGIREAKRQNRRKEESRRLQDEERVRIEHQEKINRQKQAMEEESVRRQSEHEKAERIRHERLAEERRQQQEIREEERRQQAEEERQLRTQILEIMDTLKENPLNVEKLHELPCDESFVLKAIHGRVPITVYEDAMEYYNVIMQFAREEIKLREIDAKYFINKEFADKIVSISKEKFMSYVREQTKGVSDNEELDPKLIDEIKIKEANIIGIVEEKKVLAVEIAKANVGNYEV